MSCDQHLRPTSELSEAHNWDHLGTADLFMNHSWTLGFSWCSLYLRPVRTYFYTTLRGEEAVSPKIINSGKPSKVRSSLTSVDSTNTHSGEIKAGMEIKAMGVSALAHFPAEGGGNEESSSNSSPVPPGPLMGRSGMNWERTLQKAELRDKNIRLSSSFMSSASFHVFR